MTSLAKKIKLIREFDRTVKSCGGITAENASRILKITARRLTEEEARALCPHIAKRCGVARWIVLSELEKNRFFPEPRKSRSALRAVPRTVGCNP